VNAEERRGLTAKSGELREQLETTSKPPKKPPPTSCKEAGTSRRHSMLADVRKSQIPVHVKEMRAAALQLEMATTSPFP
jgi:hypothetical protein